MTHGCTIFDNNDHDESNELDSDDDPFRSCTMGLCMILRLVSCGCDELLPVSCADKSACQDMQGERYKMHNGTDFEVFSLRMSLGPLCILPQCSWDNSADHSKPDYFGQLQITKTSDFMH